MLVRLIVLVQQKAWDVHIGCCPGHIMDGTLGLFGMMACLRRWHIDRLLLGLYDYMLCPRDMLACWGVSPCHC